VRNFTYPQHQYQPHALSPLSSSTPFLIMVWSTCSLPFFPNTSIHTDSTASSPLQASLAAACRFCPSPIRPARLSESPRPSKSLAITMIMNDSLFNKQSNKFAPIQDSLLGIMTVLTKPGGRFWPPLIHTDLRKMEHLIDPGRRRFASVVSWASVATPEVAALCSIRPRASRMKLKTSCGGARITCSQSY
jgi:hypothetical protein